jgi:hypothetical protein
MSKSDKYDQAVAKATGSHAGGEVGEIVTTPAKGAEVIVRSFQPHELEKEFAKDMNSGGYEAAPQILSLQKGQMVEGILEGNGPVAEFTDEDTGEVSHVNTWVIRDPSGAMRVSILSSAQLDRKCIGFIGHFIKIARGEDVPVKGTKRRMTEYLVWGPKLANGVQRQWFELSNEERAKLAAGNAQRAIPEKTGNA